MISKNILHNHRYRLTKQTIDAVNIHKRNFKDFARKCRQELHSRFQLDRKTERLIVFFIEGPWQKAMNEQISGGITSIESIYERTREFKTVHNAETVLCTLNGNRLHKFKTFSSSSTIIHVDQLRFFKKVREVLIHIPEHLIQELIKQAENGKLKHYLKAEKYQLNILNQNIDLMPAPYVINKLHPYFYKITQTTAHKNYNSDKFLAKYNIPYHFFSARLDISQYKFIPFAGKENLILFSPDDHHKNRRVIDLIQKHLPSYKFQTIENITYQHFKELIGKAKFCFTFGEGLDGYFIEPFFSGTISFAVYNEQFFRTPYKNLPSVFNSEEELLLNINKVISQFLSPDEYNGAVEKTNSLLNEDYNYNNYVQNIKQFYHLYFNYAS